MQFIDGKKAGCCYIGFYIYSGYPCTWCFAENGKSDPCPDRLTLEILAQGRGRGREGKQMGRQEKNMPLCWFCIPGLKLLGGAGKWGAIPEALQKRKGLQKGLKGERGGAFGGAVPGDN